MEEEKIDLKKAVIYAKQMANFFEPFKKIEEIIQNHIEYEEILGELSINKEKMLKEVESLEKKKEVLTLEIKEMLRINVNKNQEQKNIISDEFNKFKNDIESKKTILLNEYNSLKTSRETEIKELDEIVKKLKEEKTEGEILVSSLNGEILRLKNLFS